MTNSFSSQFFTSSNIAGGMTIDSNNNIYLVSSISSSGILTVISPTGLVWQNYRTSLNNPRGVNFNIFSQLYFTGISSGTLYQFTPSGTVNTLAVSNNFISPIGIDFDISLSSG